MANTKAEYVRRVLPLVIPESDLEHNPEFAKLLIDLGERHLTRTGMSKDNDVRLQKSVGAMQQEKMRYLQREALHREVHDILLESNIGGRDSFEMRDRLELLLSVAGAKNCLNFSPVDPDDSTTLLGLTEDDLDAVAHARLGKKTDLQTLQQALIPEVEARMKRKCETIFNFYAGTTGDAQRELGLAKASQLPQIVAGDKEMLAAEIERLDTNREAYLRQSQERLQIALKCIAVMDTTIREHRLGF
eukprot:Opistho-2@64949